MKPAIPGSAPPNYPYDPILLVIREAANRTSLQETLDLAPCLYGTAGELPWLLIPWVEGQSAAKVASKLRREEASATAIRDFASLFVDMSRLVARMHAAGFVHGDLQPDHFLVDDRSKVQLIDFALSKRPDDGFAYRGALLHFCAPEVSHQMYLKAPDIPIDKVSEVYSLGSVLFYLYTGFTSTDYGDRESITIPMADKLAKIASGPTRPFPEVPYRLPKIEEVLTRCLAISRDNRYIDAMQVQYQLEAAA